MLRLILIAVTLFALSMPSNSPADDKDLDELISLIPGHSVLGSLPPRSASEILAVGRLLEHERHIPPQGVHVVLPQLTNWIVLWGIADGKFVWLEAIGMDDSARVLLPLDSKAGWYPVTDPKARKCLRRLIKRIQDGRERPVARSQPGESRPPLGVD